MGTFQGDGLMADYPELPHDTFAEQYVLASCVKRPDLVASCRPEPSDFYHLAHRHASAAMLEVGAGLDELGDALHYGAAYLALWQADWSLPSQGALAAAARIRDCARHRDLASVAQRLAERAWDASRPLTANEASVLRMFVPTSM